MAEVAAALHAIFEDEGIEVRTGIRVERVEGRSGESVKLHVVRDAFLRHYSRLSARAGTAPADAEALARVQSARTETELVSAVADLHDAG